MVLFLYDTAFCCPETYNTDNNDNNCKYCYPKIDNTNNDDKCKFCYLKTDNINYNDNYNDNCEQRYLYYKRQQQSQTDLQHLELKSIPKCLLCQNFFGNVCLYCQIPLDTNNQGHTLSNLVYDNQLCRKCENYELNDEYLKQDNILVCHLDYPDVTINLINDVYGVYPLDYIQRLRLNYQIVE